MRIVIVTPVRLFGEGLAGSLDGSENIIVEEVVTDLALLRQALNAGPDLVLIDLSADFDLTEVHAIAVERPGLMLVALGLVERRDYVIRCGRAGFTAYVPRDASLQTLREALHGVVGGRLSCSPEIASSLMRALFSPGTSLSTAVGDNALTRREGEVLRLVGRGLSNKEIARELELSVATIKHHVHSIFGKLGVSGRAQAVLRVRDLAWTVVLSRVEESLWRAVEFAAFAQA
jgi:DNA-binding NarL/FixJ family response regulator